MRGNRQRRPRLLAFLFLAALGMLAAELLAATTESADKPARDAPKVIWPPDRSVLLSGNLDVIYEGSKASLEVDSRPVPWEDFYDGKVRVGHLHLSPGMHRVKVGDRFVQLCIALNEMEHDGPSDWKIQHIHSTSGEKDRCAECHDADTRDGRMFVGKALVPELCVSCHTDSEIKEPHAELIKPLKTCDTCHAMHGSLYKTLLKAPKAKIKKQYAAKK